MSRGPKSTGRYSGILIAISFLILMLSPVIVEGDSRDSAPARAEDMILGIDLDHGSVYNTSAGQAIGVSYTISGDLLVSILHGEKVINSVGIDLVRPDAPGRPIRVHTWNHTPRETAPDDPMYFHLPGHLPPGSHIVSANFTIMNISAHPYDNVSEVETSTITLLDGTNFYRLIECLPHHVDNGGTGVVDIVYESRREITEGYTMHLGFYNTDLGTWEMPQITDPLQNVTYDRAAGTSTIVVSAGIPADFPLGPYSVRSVLMDPWGYHEMVNRTAFAVIPEPLPPVLTNSTIYMMEDVPVVIDLNDHISDPNGDILTFGAVPASNSSLSLEFTNSSHVLIAPDPDWFGIETVEIWADDGTGHNLSFEFDISVEGVEDLPRPVEDLTILVGENARFVEFDPHDLFHDPDPGDEFGVSLGWEWSDEGYGIMSVNRLYHWTDGTFDVRLISTQSSEASVQLVRDVEEGRAEFPITAWMDNGTFVNSTAVVEVDPVNDPPSSSIEVFEGSVDEELVVNLPEVFTDPDNSSGELSFSIVESGPWINATIVDGVNLTIHPDQRWIGTSFITISASDGIDFTVHTFSLIISPGMYFVQGTLTYENASVHLSDVSDWELAAEVSFTSLTEMYHSAVDPYDGSFSVLIMGGAYTVHVGLKLDQSRLHIPGIRSGYESPEYFDISVNEDLYVEIIIPWIDIEDDTADWSDIDFESHDIGSADDEIKIIIPVFDPLLEGYEDVIVYLVIGDGEDELVFFVPWDPSTEGYHIRIDAEDLEDADDDYFFADGSGENKTRTFHYEFDDEEDEDRFGIIGFLLLMFLLMVGVIAALIAALITAFIAGIVIALVLMAVGLVLIVGLILISLIITAVVGLILLLIPLVIAAALTAILVVLIIGTVALFLFIGILLTIGVAAGILLLLVIILPLLVILLVGGLLLAVLIGIAALIGAIIAAVLSILFPVFLLLLLMVGAVVSVILAVVVFVIIGLLLDAVLIIALVSAVILGLIILVVSAAVAVPIVLIILIVRAVRERKYEPVEPKD
ncbi:MAG: Ig-like domain-containing protein [Thermoplasmatota archaeon]